MDMISKEYGLLGLGAREGNPWLNGGWFGNAGQGLPFLEFIIRYRLVNTSFGASKADIA